MKGQYLIGLILLSLIPFTGFHAQDMEGRQLLPAVFGKDQPDLISTGAKENAAFYSRLHQIPSTLTEWKAYRTKLISEIRQKSGVFIDHRLPLDYRETGSTQMNGYSVKNIWFQTRPGVYATANLYVPDGKGPFPAVINMHGHWPDGRMGEMVQSCAQALALHGYTCLNIDAFGAGERTTVHGADEYHGANLGASLLNIGETLLGDQLTDNIRGVDLLCSLPYVDTARIGATGASGGGNQTMWLSALDERIKAAMPVVSVGTFESYIMNSNCICELLPDGLRVAEEAGVLGLIAPRALKIANAELEKNPTFKPAEMLRSYHNTESVYRLYDKAGELEYSLYHTGHGYWPEMRQALLGWLDWKLKGMGTGDPVAEIPHQLLPVRQLLVFPEGNRDALVPGIAAWCRTRGAAIKKEGIGRSLVNRDRKRKALGELLRLPALPDITARHTLQPENGWQRIILQSDDRRLIPLLYKTPVNGKGRYVLICPSNGKDSLLPGLLKEYERQGTGIVIADLWGVGECTSPEASSMDGSLPRFHTLARSEYWLGRSVMGEWVTEMSLVIRHMIKSFHPASLTVDASKETGMAALFCNALTGNADTVILRDCPVSYAFDQRAGIDFYNMAIHVPGILPWGDVSLAAALSGKNTVFIRPVSMSGNPIEGIAMDPCRKEFGLMKSLCRSTGITSFKKQ